MDILLRIVVDMLKVALDALDEQPEPERVVLGQILVTRADCCMQIFYKDLHDPT